jgi:hypothetical protein
VEVVGGVAMGEEWNRHQGVTATQHGVDVPSEVNERPDRLDGTWCAEQTRKECQSPGGPRENGGAQDERDVARVPKWARELRQSSPNV